MTSRYAKEVQIFKYQDKPVSRLQRNPLLFFFFFEGARVESLGVWPQKNKKLFSVSPNLHGRTGELLVCCFFRLLDFSDISWHLILKFPDSSSASEKKPQRIKVSSQLLCVWFNSQACCRGRPWFTLCVLFLWVLSGLRNLCNVLI